MFQGRPHDLLTFRAVAPARFRVCRPCFESVLEHLDITNEHAATSGRRFQIFAPAVWTERRPWMCNNTMGGVRGYRIALLVRRFLDHLIRSSVDPHALIVPVGGFIDRLKFG